MTPTPTQPPPTNVKSQSLYTPQTLAAIAKALELSRVEMRALVQTPDVERLVKCRWGLGCGGQGLGPGVAFEGPCRGEPSGVSWAVPVLAGCGRGVGGVKVQRPQAQPRTNDLDADERRPIIGAGNCRLGCGCGWASGCLLGVHEALARRGSARRTANSEVRGLGTRKSAFAGRCPRLRALARHVSRDA